MTRIGNREPSGIESACSLRYIPIDIDREKQIGQPNVLVALDGVNGCATVLDWFIENADVFKGYNVILRAHPNVTLGRLLEQCLNELPDHFHESDEDLKTDIERCFCVIYRQSSVGLQALMNGVPVIHVNIDAPLPCDPIMSLKALKWTVRTPGELINALKEIEVLEQEKVKESMHIAQEYADEYFAPPDNKNSLKFVTVDQREWH
jgi:hypothetical protein